MPKASVNVSIFIYPIYMVLFFIIAVIVVLFIATSSVAIEAFAEPAAEAATAEAAEPEQPITYNVASRLRHGPLITKIIGTHKLHTPDGQIDRLERYDLDFVIDLEMTIYRQYRASLEPRNVRFITSLYVMHAIFLTPNDSNIVELSDIRRYSCPVTILVSNDRDRLCAEHIMNYYGYMNEKGQPAKVKILNAGTKAAEAVTERYLAAEPAVIYFTLTSDKFRSPILKALTEAIPSHMVAPRALNNGTFHITYDQKPFYDRYPYYHKAMTDLLRFNKLYPMLTMVPSVARSTIYMRTIKTGYILLCHDRISNAKVKDIIRRSKDSARDTGWDAHIAIPSHRAAI